MEQVASVGYKGLMFCKNKLRLAHSGASFRLYSMEVIVLGEAGKNKFN